VKETRLVVGGDSLIGRALSERWRSIGVEVYRTTRRQLPDASESVHFDLETGTDPWRSSWKRGVAVVCAGITSLRECQRDPAGTRLVNVDRTVELATTLARRHGVRVVWLSTNLVFDGRIAHCPPDSPRCPHTEYGRQKASAEAELETLPGVSIVRLTKVVHRDWPLFASWRDDLLAGRLVRAHVDQKIAPITLDKVADAVMQIADGGHAGTWQLSGPVDVSYAEFAREIARRLDRPPRLITQSRASEETQVEQVPRHTTLDTRRVREELGLHFDPPDEIVRQLVRSESPEVVLG